MKKRIDDTFRAFGPDRTRGSCVGDGRGGRGCSGCLAHDSTTGDTRPSHTAFVLEQSVWWPGMKESITKYCQSCLQCRSHKKASKDADLGELYEKARRFGVIFIDWIPMPSGKGGLGGFYLVRCAATGWLQIYPFAQRSAENTVLAIESWM